MFHRGHVAVAAGFEILAQVFHHAEADVVAGVFVLGAGVTEAYDQEFHGGVDWFFSRRCWFTEQPAEQVEHGGEDTARTRVQGKV